MPGAPGGTGRGVAFGSEHGLATLRSNPFSPPATGRLSIALWLRIEPGEPQPGAADALEGLENDREYYRFAAVGHGPASRPLTPLWSQFVLQVDDLPTRGMESLRVRLDLLAGGTVQIDDVRIFDLAFDESQRVQLSKVLALADHHLASGDLGACVLDLDSHWPRFLDAFVTEDAADRAALAAGIRSRHGTGEEGNAAPGSGRYPRHGSGAKAQRLIGPGPGSSTRSAASGNEAGGTRQPGGQVSGRPARRWRWRWSTDWPPSRPQLNTSR